jgi:hypothetical protein
MQLVMYISDYARSLDHLNDDLRDILQTSQINNSAQDITGVLFFDNGKFIQILEGNVNNLDALMGHIQQDERHKNVKLLINEPIEKREILDWNMKAFDLAEHDAQDWALLEELRDAYLKTFKVSSKQISSWVQHFIKDYDRFKKMERHS